MARIEHKKYRVPHETVVNIMTGRNLHKTQIDRDIYERAVGMRRPNGLSHRNNTKFRELPYH